MCECNRLTCSDGIFPVGGVETNQIQRNGKKKEKKKRNFEKIIMKQARIRGSFNGIEMKWQANKRNSQQHQCKKNRNTKTLSEKTLLQQQTAICLSKLIAPKH